jgi:hypothetical protein
MGTVWVMGFMHGATELINTTVMKPQQQGAHGPKMIQSITRHEEKEVIHIIRTVHVH